jgi:hypothetical protein
VNVNRKVLGEIAGTVCVVVNANPATKGVYAFTDRPWGPARRGLFDAVGGLSTPEFYRLVRPVVVERDERIGPFPIRVLDRPGVSGRPIPLTADHPFIVQALDNLKGEASPAAAAHAGQMAFAQVATGNRAWAAAAPHTPVLGDILSAVLGKCSSDEGFAPYRHGEPLPVGLLEAYLDFLYGDAARPNLERVAWPAGWDKVAAKKSDARTLLLATFDTIREQVLGSERSQHTGISLPGFGPLPEVVADVIKETAERGAAVVAIGKGIAGRKRALDVMSNKLLCMAMMDWILSALIAMVRKAAKLGPEADDYTVMEAVKDAIRHGKHGLKEAVVRPSGAQQRAFGKLLTKDFEAVFRAIVSHDKKELQKLVGTLSAESQALVTELRANADLCETLRKVSGGDNEEIRAGFVRANQLLLRDILVSELCVPVILSIRGVKAEIRKLLLGLYLAAVGMDPGNEREIRAIAARNVARFQELVAEIDQETGNTRSFIQHILGEYFQHLTNPKTAEKLQEAVATIREALALEDAAADAQSTRVWESIRQPRETRRKVPGSVARTRASAEIVNRVVDAIVGGKVKEKIRNARQAKPQAQAVAAAVAPPADEVSRQPASTNGADHGDQLPAGEAAHAPNGRHDAKPATENAGEHDGSVLLSKLDRLLEAHVQARQAAGTAEIDPEKAVGPALANLHNEHPAYVEEVADALTAFDRILYFIFETYADPEHNDKKEFLRSVERLALLRVMSSEGERLGLGREDSAMLNLLSHMIAHIDPERLDPEPLLAEVSLTQFVEQTDQLVALLDAARIQWSRSGQNLVTTVSDVAGVASTLETAAAVKNKTVVVFNMTAAEFLQFVARHSLAADVEGSKGMFRAGRWHDEMRFLAALAIYFAPTAFPDNDPVAFARQLTTMPVADAFSVILPPLLIDTGAQNSPYRATARQILSAAEGAPVAVHVLGPRFTRRAAGSEFATVLGDGFAALARLLGGILPNLTTANVGASRDGRFCPLPAGEMTHEHSVERWLRGNPKLDSTPPAAVPKTGEGESAATAAEPTMPPTLATDLFLYVTAGLAATARERDPAFDAAAFYLPFYFHPQQPDTFALFEETDELVAAWPPGVGPRRLAFANPVFDDDGKPQPLQGVRVPKGDGPLGPKVASVLVPDVRWWNELRTKGKLP